MFRRSGSNGYLGAIESITKAVIMSYTIKVILISLASWLVFSALAGAVFAFSGEDYWVIGGLISGMIIGIAGVIGLVITGAVILLGKMDGKSTKEPSKDSPLDAGPVKLSYRERGLAFFAAAGTILVIGASICFGMV